jgi:hypothetical protein
MAHSCFGYPISKNHKFLYHSINDYHIEQFINIINNNKRLENKLINWLTEISNVKNINYNTFLKHNSHIYHQYRKEIL